MVTANTDTEEEYRTREGGLLFLRKGNRGGRGRVRRKGKGDERLGV